MPKKSKKKIEEEKKLFAFLATFLSIIGFVIAILAKKDDKYVMFYAKQSLIVFIMGAVAGALGSMLYFLPIIGTIIDVALNVIVLIAWAISWINALSGKMKEVPIIGLWARKLKI